MDKNGHDTEPTGRFIVRASFTITGQGTCAAGYTVDGVIRTGDRLEWLDGETLREAACARVAMITERPVQHPPTIGLIVADTSPDEFVEGMEIRAFHPNT